MKATTLLEHQHRNLEVLFDAVERGSAGMRASLLPQLASDLVAHIAVEEEVFYPAASAALCEQDVVVQGRAACERERETLRRALSASLDGDDFDRVIAELRVLVDRHAADDEGRIFPLLERALGGAAMRELGEAIAALYDATIEASAAVA